MTNWQERIDCRFPPGTHPGILLIRARNKGRDAVMAILRCILSERTLESLRGCLAVATEEHTRIRGQDAGCAPDARRPGQHVGPPFSVA